MRNRIILSIGLLFAISGAGIIGYRLGQQHPISIDTVSVSVNRCEANVDGYKLQMGPINTKYIAKTVLWHEAKTIIVKEGRHKGDKGISLLWFFEKIGKGRAIEVQPCTGEPILIRFDKIVNDPERYVLVKSDHGNLKLMDFKNNLKKPLLKKIHLFRIHPNQGRKL